MVDMPAPVVSAGSLVISTRASLISAGTERMLVDFGRADMLRKVRQQPEKVRQVLDKMRSDGVLQTLEAVRSKLGQPLPLGYCNVGIVEEVGSSVKKFVVGDRVASNGAHAELVNVPQNLCARVPDNVTDDVAAFTVIGAIGLQGVRLAQPTLGECFVVTGLGLIGLITVQLLRAHGCRVLGIDLDEAKLAIAKKLGAEAVKPSSIEELLSVASSFSRGRGIDGVIITASTKSNDPMSQAAKMCRKRGRIVLVGVAGLELNRADFYEKELTFQVSCSYGPGRYDPFYEELSQDYPIGFVRWTEQRNFEAILDMMADGRLDMESLISHRFVFEDAPKAYDLLYSGSEPYLGILLRYCESVDKRRRSIALSGNESRKATTAQVTDIVEDKVVVGVIGAGNYAGRVLIPAFHEAGVRLEILANSGGVNGAHYARKFRFREVTTDVAALMKNDQLNSIVIATRHDSHAHYVCQALRSGKHVFCEKPLALTLQELQSIREVWEVVANRAPRLLMIGFNRRFAPLILKMKEMITNITGPKVIVITVNAGAVPENHWTQNVNAGGGRLVGEACHFVDLLRYLIGASIKGWSVETIKHSENVEICDDKATITLTFSDGSMGTIHYLANGHKSFPKERVEAFCDGRVLQLDNYRRLTAYGWRGFRGRRLWRQDKGQQECVKRFIEAVCKGKPAPIAIEEIFEVSEVSIRIADQARSQ